MNPVDLCLRQVGQNGQIGVGGQELGLEPAHLAGRGRLLRNGMAADDPPHGRITPKTVGVVHVLVAAETSEGGLPEQSRHPVLSVPAGSRINKPFPRNHGEAESVVEFPKRQESGVRGDVRPMKLQLQPTVNEHSRRRWRTRPGEIFIIVE